MYGAQVYRTHVYRAQVYSPTIGVLDPIVQIPGVPELRFAVHIQVYRA